MAFSEETKRKIFDNAKGRCQGYGCDKELVYENHTEGERGAWDAHHIIPVKDGGTDEASNGKALCLDCHKNTSSYGSHG